VIIPILRSCQSNESHGITASAVSTVKSQEGISLKRQNINDVKSYFLHNLICVIEGQCIYLDTAAFVGKFTFLLKPITDGDTFMATKLPLKKLIFTV